MKAEIRKTVEALGAVSTDEALRRAHTCPPPDRQEVVKVIHELQALLFPLVYRREYPNMADETLLSQALYRLRDQLAAALRFRMEAGEAAEAAAEEICAAFAERLPEVKRLLLLDVEALYEGDPAAVSREEVMISYPGFRAITIFRIAHELYLLKAPLIPRIMTEYAHERTGIDIHPGATVGEYFFIDHGTGVVIGETTEIGSHAKIYQGVTLGATSTRKGQALSGTKRHPTLGDYVTVYSNASVLGGNTYIGSGSVIGGSAFVVESVPENGRVFVKDQEIVIRQFGTPNRSGATRSSSAANR